MYVALAEGNDKRFYNNILLPFILHCSFVVFHAFSLLFCCFYIANLTYNYVSLNMNARLTKMMFGSNLQYWIIEHMRQQPKKENIAC